MEEDRATHDPEAVEAASSTLESALAPVLERVIAQGFEDADDWAWYRLIQFTALQTVRGRRWRNDLAAAGAHAAQMMVLANLDEARLREWLQCLPFVFSRVAVSPAQLMRRVQRSPKLRGERK